MQTGSLHYPGKNRTTRLAASNNYLSERLVIEGAHFVRPALNTAGSGIQELSYGPAPQLFPCKIDWAASSYHSLTCDTEESPGRSVLARLPR